MRRKSHLWKHRILFYFYFIYFFVWEYFEQKQENTKHYLAPKTTKKTKRKRKSRSLSFCRPLLRTVPGDEGAWTDGRRHSFVCSFVPSFVRAWMIGNDVVSVPWFLPFSVHPLTRSGPAVVVAGPLTEASWTNEEHLSMHPFIHSFIQWYLSSIYGSSHSHQANWTNEEQKKFIQWHLSSIPGSSYFPLRFFHFITDWRRCYCGWRTFIHERGHVRL